MLGEGKVFQLNFRSLCKFDIVIGALVCISFLFFLLEWFLEDVNIILSGLGCNHIVQFYISEHTIIFKLVSR